MNILLSSLSDLLISDITILLPFIILFSLFFLKVGSDFIFDNLKYEKKYSMKIVLPFLVFIGFLISLLSFIISNISGINPSLIKKGISSIIWYYIYVGFLEEALKLIWAFAISYFFSGKEEFMKIKNLIPAIFLSVIAFSSFENFKYLSGAQYQIVDWVQQLNTENLPAWIMVRFVFSFLSHMVYALIIAWTIKKFVDNDKSIIKGIIVWLLYAIVLHAIFNIFLTIGWVYAILAYIWPIVGAVWLYWLSENRREESYNERIWYWYY